MNDLLITIYYLRQEGYVLGVSVCLSVHMITQKVMKGPLQNVECELGLTNGRSDLIEIVSLECVNAIFLIKSSKIVTDFV